MADFGLVELLGRLYVYALLKNIPDKTVKGLLTQLHLAGIDVGQRHHYAQVSSAYGGIVARMCLQAKALEFGMKPKTCFTLQHGD